jgi:hypothetical protein
MVGEDGQRSMERVYAVVTSLYRKVTRITRTTNLEFLAVSDNNVNSIESTFSCKTMMMNAACRAAELKASYLHRTA